MLYACISRQGPGLPIFGYCPKRKQLSTPHYSHNIRRVHTAVRTAVYLVFVSQYRYHTNIPGMSQAGGDFEILGHDTTICIHS